MAQCTARPTRSTLTTECYGACHQSAPFCVNYAPRPTNESMKEGDGNYYYEGCAYTQVSTCVSDVGAAQCELQCLQSKNQDNVAWVVDVAPTQADRIETALFLQVAALSLPSSLLSFKIVETTEKSRKIPITFDPHALSNAANLQNVTIMDIDLQNISANFFPSSVVNIDIERTNLVAFSPVGDHSFPNLKSLDLSYNNLTTIPKAVFGMSNLQVLHLTNNPIDNAHLTTEQVKFLQNLQDFQGVLKLSSAGCKPGYTSYTWGNNQTVCSRAGGLGSDTGDGTLPDTGSSRTSSTQHGSKTLSWSLLFGILGFVLLALFVGCFFLKRSRVRKDSHNLHAEGDDRTATLSRKLSTRSGSGDNLAMPFHAVTPPPRKSTIREIAAEEVSIGRELARVGVATIAVAEYNKNPVVVSRLKVSDDPAENCEAALAATRIMSQLRHPHLLGLMGYMWQDVHILNAVCEPMDLGTLGSFLRSARSEISWKTFKLQAALDVATCLMCLHQQHNLTYDALNDRTVLVDSRNGCKLSILIASLPRSMLRPEQDANARIFVAPEVLTDDSSSHASDMYSFGVLLVLLDTCEVPRDLTNVRFSSSCPSTVKSVAESCLQHDPSMRPSAQFASAQLQLLRKA